MGDVVSELNRYAKLTDLEAADIMEEAAAEILRLRAELKESRRLFARETDEYIKWMDEAQAENAKLRAALKPFADIKIKLTPYHTDPQAREYVLLTADLRAAAAALKETDKREEWLNPNLDIENFRARLDAMGNPITEQLQTDRAAALKETGDE